LGWPAWSPQALRRSCPRLGLAFFNRLENKDQVVMGAVPNLCRCRSCRISTGLASAQRTDRPNLRSAEVSRTQRRDRRSISRLSRARVQATYSRCVRVVTSQGLNHRDAVMRAWSGTISSSQARRQPPGTQALGQVHCANRDGAGRYRVRVKSTAFRPACATAARLSQLGVGCTNTHTLLA